MSEREKIRRYLRKKMKRLTQSSIPRSNPRSKKDTTFHFCWGQAMFDVLMDIDIELKLGAFMKRRTK